MISSPWATLSTFITPKTSDSPTAAIPYSPPRKSPKTRFCTKVCRVIMAPSPRPSPRGRGGRGQGRCVPHHAEVGLLDPGVGQQLGASAVLGDAALLQNVGPAG